MLRTFLITAATISLLSGCASNSNTLDINPQITLPQADPSLMATTISITGADRRNTPALAQISRDNRLVNLTSSRDMRFLLQESLEKQMTARGYMIGANGVVDLQIIVNKLYAAVSQGDLRYTINTEADIAIIATAKNGNKQIKNYRQRYSVQGPFSASNSKITEAVNSTLSGVITDMSQDTSISDFIKQNSH